jgi:hypothetical protein
MQRTCDACGAPYEARSPRSKFCTSADCKRQRERARNARRAGKAPAEVVPLPVSLSEGGPNERVTAEELERAGRLDTVAGQNALTLARRLDAAAGDTGSSFAALSKQHLAAVDRALEGAEAAGDELDELKERRLRRLHA